MEYRQPVARSKAVRFLAYRRDGPGAAYDPPQPGGQAAARLSRWVISATCLSCCTAPSWFTAPCQPVAGSSLIACSGPGDGPAAGEQDGAAPGRWRQQVIDELVAGTSTVDADQQPGPHAGPGSAGSPRSARRGSQRRCSSRRCPAAAASPGSRRYWPAGPPVDGSHTRTLSSEQCKPSCKVGMSQQVTDTARAFKTCCS
jgi:hypothetical protein